MKTVPSLVTIALVAATASFAFVGCKTQEHAATASSSYLLTKCVVTGEDLDAKPYIFVHNGQQVRLCCKDCLAKFNQDPEKYMAKLNATK